MSTADDLVADPGQDEAVIYEVTATGVAVMTLNRPDRLNTWGGDIATAFYAGLDRAEEDPAVRVIVLTGRGKAFCAGAQLGSMGNVAESIEKTDEGKLASLVGDRQPQHLTTLCKPVIAAINGSCVGIGLTQALMCDVRFAAAGAKFAASFARRGLIAEYGVSWILPRLTGWGVALDLLLSGRRSGATWTGQRGRAARTTDDAGDGLRRGHRPKLFARIDGRHQAPGLRRCDAGGGRLQLAVRGLTAAIAAASRRHRRDHQLPRKALPEFPRAERLGDRHRRILRHRKG